jgi:hypothetical protein
VCPHVNDKEAKTMGDGSDHADIARFMRSAEGQAYLKQLASVLTGRRIEGVVFENQTHHLATVLQLDNGCTFSAVQSEHEAETLRGNFGGAIQEEYYREYPERRGCDE